MEEKLIKLNYMGNTLYGVQHIPNEIKSNIVFVHGVPGDRVDARRINVRLARYLQKNGHCSYRFDFLATGISCGRYENVTCETYMEQIELIVSFIKQSSDRSIYLLAFSDSAKAVLRYAQQSESIEGVIIINGIVTTEAAESTGVNRVYRINGQFVCDIGYGVWINTELIKDKFTLRLDHLGKKKILFIYGTGDPLVKKSMQEVEKLKGNCYKITDADHLFTNRRWESELIHVVADYINGEKL